MNGLRRRHGWLVTAGLSVGLAPLAAIHLWFSFNAGPGGFLSDDAVYLLMAEWFAGSREPVVEFLLRHSHLPPGYPLALALVGATGDRPLPGHLLNGALFCALLFAAWHLHRLRQPAWLAFACCAVLALTPASLMQSLTLWSEPLYTLLSLICLSLLQRQQLDARRWLALAVLLGLALAVRTAAVALLLTVLVRALQDRPAKGWLYALPILAPIAAWRVLQPSTGLANGYLEFLQRAIVTDDGFAVLPVLMRNAAALPSGWAGIFDLLQLDAARTAVWLVSAVATAAWLPRLLALRSDAVYVLVYVAMVLPWPATPDIQQRLLLPLLPLVLGYACDGGLWLGQRLRRASQPLRGIAAGLPLVLATSAMLPSIALVATRTTESMPAQLEVMRYSPWWLREPVRVLALQEVRFRASAVLAARELRHLIDSDECFYAQPVQIYLLHSRRIAFRPPPADSREWPLCPYIYAPGSVQNVVLMDGVAAGSVLVYRASLPDTPGHIVGLLFELPTGRASVPEASAR